MTITKKYKSADMCQDKKINLFVGTVKPGFERYFGKQNESKTQSKKKTVIYLVLSTSDSFLINS